MKHLFIFLSLLLVLVNQLMAAPFQDAAVCWSMADAGATHALQPHGKVTFGVELEGAERAASLARGGDGKAARFEGGYLALADDAQLKINPKQWTIAIRMRDPQGAWCYPILGSYGSDKTVSMALRAVDLASKPMEDRNYVVSPVPTVESWFAASDGPRAVSGSSLIEAVWGAKEPNAARVKRIRDFQPATTPLNQLKQDVLNGVMRVNFPAGLIGPGDWHDIVLSMTGPKLELWIDGVLVDEEYPVGETRPCSMPFLIGAGHENGELKTGFRGLVDHVAVWNRPLSPDEIAALSGGKEHVRKRELAILGNESVSMQYFRPRGHNRKAGDCIPYWDAQSGTFRLFYLILRRNMHSKWDGGHGGLEIWQASTKDLKTWTHHPVTIPITEQWEAWNGTGAVVFHNGQHNWFYPTPDYDGDHGGVQRAVSKDGVTFTKTSPHPFLPGGDVEIFQTEHGLFHLIKAGSQQRAKTKPLRNKTLVAWVRLADLEQGGGSVLTVEHPDATQFDGVVFGECSPHRWMPGSENHRRTPRNQNAWDEEAAKPDAVVQIAIAYDGAKGALYRNGALYASYPVKSPVVFPTGSSLLMGLRHTTAGGKAFFRGRILDARVYDTALSPDQLAALKPDAPAGPKPVAWYDFEGGSLRDRSGTFPDAMLFGNARIENGELVLGDGDYLKVPGSLYTQVRLTSPDLEKWTEQPGTFITADKHLAICPNVFKFGAWHYYICGSGVWKSRGWFGPWTQNTPHRLDNLAVPKTGEFGKGRRIYAGFLPDDGWGGNEVLRELVQDADGDLGTRFVNEMIPDTGAPLPLRESVRVAAAKERQIVELPGIPQDYRLQMEVAPEPGASAFGVSLRADGSDGCELTVEPSRSRVSFSKMIGSSGKAGGGPGIEAVRGLDKPFIVDIIVRHDILDAEIAGRRSLVTRFWNPASDRLRFFAEGGAVTFRNIRVSPLKETYKPYPASQPPGNPLALNFHLMHPGGESLPGDPNAAFYLDGVYHLHYILAHPWKDKRSFSFVHVTSPDMLHWTWQTTKLQPSFTGHGMFSGTGFITKEGKPAAIYHGQASSRNQIAIAKDRRLLAWEKPYPVEVKNADGTEAKIRHWDPDCFLIGDTYYAISGGDKPPLFKSKDLKNWTLVGDFLRHDLPDVAAGEDISCGNFFPIGNKWMLLCISHPLGCRYYIGDWDAKAEQFVPQKHGRMNWRREEQSIFGTSSWRVDYFAPESLLTPDGRRVMWAWLATLGKTDGKMDNRTIQSLPRELSLLADGILRIKPLRELESLRHAPVTLSDIKVSE
ncbi:MAG: LamG-like jellyroll fold domain-containing protein, partial [Verrucomicrobiia bacterium]